MNVDGFSRDKKKLRKIKPAQLSGTYLPGVYLSWPGRAGRTVMAAAVCRVIEKEGVGCHKLGKTTSTDDCHNQLEGTCQVTIILRNGPACLGTKVYHGFAIRQSHADVCTSLPVSFKVTRTRHLVRGQRAGEIPLGGSGEAPPTEESSTHHPPNAHSLAYGFPWS